MYLSELKYSDILFRLSCDELERIVFLKNKEIKQADIGIVLGGISMIPYRVDKAYQLYKDGTIKKILLSGGIGYFNKKRNVSEASLMKKYLLDLGVLEEDILIEDKSRNTVENILYTYNYLINKINLKKTKFILITSDFHIKRANLLFKKTFRNSFVIPVGINDNKVNINSWRGSFYGRRRIKQEALLLCYYVRKKIIDDIKIKR